MRKIGRVISLLLTLGLLCSCGPQPAASNSNPPTNTAGEPAEFGGYVLHAGGSTPAGEIGTNSVEAMNHSYEQGYYWLEMDFNWTSDGALVCLHDWDAYYAENRTGVPVPDLSLFESLRTTLYDFESPTLDSLVLWLKDHPKAVIVTDVKDDPIKAAALIAVRYPDMMDRFAIQIYHPEEYEIVEGLGFEKILYTLYLLTYQEKYDADALAAFAKGKEHLMAFIVGEAPENPNLIKNIADIGLPVYMHTINDPESQANWRKYGVDGFYCDYIAE